MGGTGTEEGRSGRRRIVCNVIASTNSLGRRGREVGDWVRAINDVCAHRRDARTGGASSYGCRGLADARQTAGRGKLGDAGRVNSCRGTGYTSRNSDRDRCSNGSGTACGSRRLGGPLA